MNCILTTLTDNQWTHGLIASYRWIFSIFLVSAQFSLKTSQLFLLFCRPVTQIWEVFLTARRHRNFTKSFWFHVFIHNSVLFVLFTIRALPWYPLDNSLSIQQWSAPSLFRKKQSSAIFLPINRRVRSRRLAKDIITAKHQSKSKLFNEIYFTVGQCLYVVDKREYPSLYLWSLETVRKETNFSQLL